MQYANFDESIFVLNRLSLIDDVPLMDEFGNFWEVIPEPDNPPRQSLSPKYHLEEDLPQVKADLLSRISKSGKSTNFNGALMLYLSLIHI